MAIGPRERVYIAELAREVDRDQDTIRGWCRDVGFPTRLQPNRDGRGWRYWSPAQVKLIVTWMHKTGRDQISRAVIDQAREARPDRRKTR